jgi:hypothetical protein
MSITEIHYKKTLTLLETLQINDVKALKNISLADVDDMLEIVMKQSDIKEKLTEENLQQFQEICAIEQEKYAIRDAKNTVKEIYNEDLLNCQKRNQLLAQPFGNLLHKKFVVSPFVTTYEADWKWIVREAYAESLEIQKIINSNAQDHYFVFQRSGMFDDAADTNVLEFPLSEDQYFMLRLFESPNTILENSNRFISQFEIASEEELQQLLSFTESLLRELIFRTFLVAQDG